MLEARIIDVGEGPGGTRSSQRRREKKKRKELNEVTKIQPFLGGGEGKKFQGRFGRRGKNAPG